MKYSFFLFLLVLLFSCQENAAETQPAPEPPPRILIHPGMDITLEELNATLTNLPEEAVQRIQQRPQYFLELMLQALDLPYDALVLVDKQHSLSENHQPDQIVDLDDYSLLSKNRAGHQLGSYALPSILAMSEAASLEGIDLVISSTYRSYDYQATTYQWCVDHYGQEEADRVSAQPGKSQHQLGLAIDFGSITEAFEYTEAGQWLIAHAGEYGWSMSYPRDMEDLTGYKYEVWHYRYITPLGTEIQREFFLDIQQYFLQYFHDNRDFFQEARN